MKTLMRNGALADRRLGALFQPDRRNAEYPLRALLTTEERRSPRSYTWAPGPVLDQGSEGTCVGHAVAHEAAAKPVVVKGVTHDIARSVFCIAASIDPWDGDCSTGDYNGTSILAGMKAGVQMGWFEEYRWPTDFNDFLVGVGFKGPAIIGIPWFSGMMQTDDSGFIRRTGVAEGRHAVMVFGLNLRSGFVKIQNSWGPRWGKLGNGVCYMEISELQKSLFEDEYGEAVFPVKRSL